MDLLQGVQDMQEDAMGPEEASQQFPGGNGALPSVEELLKALDGMTGMSDEDKQQLRDQLLNQSVPSNGQNLQQFFILISLLFVIACIFVFFGYKLYKSLADKERKRDEKRKMKQMKKKK